MTDLAKRLREWIPGSAFSKKLVNEGADALDRRDKALAWYQERAASINESFRILGESNSIAVHDYHSTRVQVIATELSLDGGARAMEAMNDSET